MREFVNGSVDLAKEIDEMIELVGPRKPMRRVRATAEESSKVLAFNVDQCIKRMIIHSGHFLKGLSINRQVLGKEKGPLRQLFFETLVIAKVAGITGKEIVEGFSEHEPAVLQRALLKFFTDLARMTETISTATENTTVLQRAVKEHTVACINDLFVIANGLGMTDKKFCDKTKEVIGTTH